MKFPKLKNRHMCKIIIYSPAFLWLLIALILVIFQDFMPEEIFGPICFIVFFVGCIAALAYLLLNAIWLINMDCLLEEIRVWKSARMWYETSRNGNERKTAEKRILNRMQSFGRRCEIIDREIPPLEVRRKFGASWATAHWRAVERFCMVYSVPLLDEITYRRVVSSAIRNVRSSHDESQKILLLDKEQKSSPVATAVCVIILADKISKDIPDMVIRENLPSPFGEATVCVGDMSCCKYYFNSVREGFYLGIERKPEKNYTFEIIKRIVFGGKLPLKGNENYVLLNKEHEELKVYTEKSLWEYLKEDILPFLKRSKREIKEEIKIKKSIKNLAESEVAVMDGKVYCKYNNEITMRPFKAAESNAKNIAVCRFNQWIYPNKRTMSKVDMSEVEKLMEAYLISVGYTVEFKSFEEMYDKKGEKQI